MATDDKPKLIIPPLTDEQKTFDHAQDALKRGGFGSRLTQLILNNASNELTIAIDAPWGEGKTVFVQMWQKSLKEAGIYSIYYDAFASDFHDQPLLPFFAEVNNLLSPPTPAEKGMKQAGDVVLPVMGDVMSLVIGYFLPGVPGAVSNIASKTFEEMLKNFRKYENQIDELRGLLKQAPQNLAEPYRNNPIVFIIDELDRCKPSHAIKLLEIVKHLFRVPNIVFVLSINSAQLQEAIKHEYGENIDAYNYLHKFIDYSFLLTNANRLHGNVDIKTYVKHCFNKLNLSDGYNEYLCIHFSIQFRFSLRQIEKYLSNLRLALLMKNDAKFYVDVLVVLLCAIKIKDRQVYSKLAATNVKYENIMADIDPDHAIRNSNNPFLMSVDDVLKMNLGGDLLTLKVLGRNEEDSVEDYKRMKEVIELLDSMQ